MVQNGQQGIRKLSQRIRKKSGLEAPRARQLNRTAGPKIEMDRLSLDIGDNDDAGGADDVIGTCRDWNVRIRIKKKTNFWKKRIYFEASRTNFLHFFDSLKATNWLWCCDNLTKYTTRLTTLRLATLWTDYKARKGPFAQATDCSLLNFIEYSAHLKKPIIIGGETYSGNLP